MNILLVRTNRPPQAITVADLMYSEPLGLEMVYSVFKEKAKVEIFDMMADATPLINKLESFKPDIVGVTSLCIDRDSVIDVCKKVKDFNQSTITLVGGTQTELMPESFFHSAVDYIFQTTNEENLLGLLEQKVLDGIYSRENNFKKIKTGHKSWIMPDRGSTTKYRKDYSYFGFKPAALAQLGTGCNSCCDFCLRWRIEGAKESVHPYELIKEDLNNILEPTIMFIDNDILQEGKPELLLRLIDELNLNKRYIGYASVKNILSNEHLLGNLHQKGLNTLLVGYETFEDKELADYNKKSNTKDNLKAAKLLNKHKIEVWASFIAHPDWTKNDFKKLKRFIKKLSPEVSTISPLTPFPTLPMYKKYEDRLLYKVEAYDKFSFGQVIIRPSNMSLRSYYFELLKVYLYVNIFINKNTGALKRYGFKNALRLAIGSFKTAIKYLKLMYSIK